MIQKNRKMLIITSIIILLPILAGLLLWQKLPESIATHWNAQGVADGFSHKTFAVFGLPLFMFAVHWICFLITAADPKNKNIGGKTLGIVLWICPILSLLTGCLVYAAALGMDVSAELIAPMIIGAMFILIGNYLPKCRQNYTVGIKVPWTLHDEENWNHTHRFAGPVWVISGVITLGTALLKTPWILLAVLLFAAILPVIYSYVYYRRHKGQ
ncbi:MAG: SdpI family protein [Ruminococcus sp.]|nr:SdpI family protein [Ruminococcus sp.]